MGKKSGPAPPDPKDLASAATSTNIATAVANQASASGSRSGPFGSVTQKQEGTHKYTDPYTGQTHEIPIFSTERSIDPELEEGLRGATSGISLGQGPAGARIKELLGESGTSGIEARDRAEAALRERSAPGREEANRRRQIELSRRGIGSFSTATGGEGRIAEGARRRQVQQETDADLAITAAGGREQSLQSSIRGQELSQLLGTKQAQANIRGGNINRINAALSGSPVAGGTGVNIPTTDVAGLINQQHQGRLQRFGQQSANRNQLLGGLFGLGAAFL